MQGITQGAGKPRGPITITPQLGARLIAAFVGASLLSVVSDLYTKRHPLTSQFVTLSVPPQQSSATCISDAFCQSSSLGGSSLMQATSTKSKSADVAFHTGQNSTSGELSDAYNGIDSDETEAGTLNSVANVADTNGSVELPKHAASRVVEERPDFLPINVFLPDGSNHTHLPQIVIPSVIRDDATAVFCGYGAGCNFHASDALLACMIVIAVLAAACTFFGTQRHRSFIQDQYFKDDESSDGDVVNPSWSPSLTPRVATPPVGECDAEFEPAGECDAEFEPADKDQVESVQSDVKRIRMMHSGLPVESAACDLVIVFPLCGDKATNFHISGTQAISIKWDRKVPAREMAREAFMDPSKAHIISEQDVLDKFEEEMTFVNYSHVAASLLVELLTGPKLGLKASSFPSVDHDEVFTKLHLPRGITLGQYAEHFRYGMPLADSCYRTCNTAVPINYEHSLVRAHCSYMRDHSEMFGPFRRVDRLLLSRAGIDAYIDLGELAKQGLIVEYFCAHDRESIDEFLTDWASPAKWYRVSFSDEDLEEIRNYFGEEGAWIFVWQNFLMRWLLVPAIAGGLCFFRRFFLSLEDQRTVQFVFAMFMCIWASVFNQMYARHEARLRQRWGMDLFTPAVYIRNEYDPELEDSCQVTTVHWVTDILALAVCMLTVFGQKTIQTWRETMITTESYQFWQNVSAILVSLQIMFLDLIWRLVSKRLVDLENHKSRMRWQNAWVLKMCMVRIFNNIYPFIYVGFLKQFSPNVGCPVTEAGCIDELNRNLLCYFILRVGVHIATDLYLAVVCHIQIFRDFQGTEERDRHFTYLQIQAKMQNYDDTMQMDDYTELLLTFMFLVCFNVVLPSIAVLALLTTMLEARCMAYRNCVHLRRPKPTGSTGIGSWQTVFEFVEVIAVLINVSFAVFTMQPWKDMSVGKKFVVFLGVEHTVLLVKLLFKAKFPSTPMDVDEIYHSNEDILRRTFITSSTSKLRLDVSPSQPEVGPHAFGGRARRDRLRPQPTVWNLATRDWSRTNTL